MDKAVDVAQKTADVNIISRYYKYRKDAQEIEDSDIPEPSDEIDVQECLQIIHLIATLCAKDAEDMARFWGGDVARFDFISMLLRATQELDDIIIMVKILMTSVRETGFALERTRGWDKSTVQEHLIDRITSMLIEVPRRPDSEEGYDVVEISELRQQLLCLLEEICTKQYCAAILANHNFAIGRLVRLMHDELNAVYNHQYGHEHR